ncbi:transcriptional regulator LytR [Bacillus sp. FJAT-27225]|uniref:LCP family glycopolymer transferase n=1 Tax=Bacillus sp. FJAT-27225 TaxID=1743144 RepID=UPI00080C33AC|nr:LCP family protein [Bacillus sp. FJAT-27225]OCA85954.1 transcriptional regulator LytR [Bacillus sp. FJAT-27225]
MKKAIKIFIILLGVIAIGIGGFVFYVYDSVKDTADQMHEDIKLNRPESKPVITQNSQPSNQQTSPSPQPISILIMGVDERAGDRGRSDTLIAMTLNPEKETMQMVSIPRDTRTEIIGRGTIDKINHAYAFGGTKMSIETVENFTGVKMDYFIRVNMSALETLVDAVGGVTVHNDLDWFDEGYYEQEQGYHYKKGEIELNGDMALGYVRMRYLDPEGDFGRNRRQRQVIEAFINKAASVTSITRFKDILAALGDNVKTNMTFDDMMAIQKNYRASRNTITQYQIQGTGKKINGIYYFIVSDQERAKVTSLLKGNL